MTLSVDQVLVAVTPTVDHQQMFQIHGRFSFNDLWGCRGSGGGNQWTGLGRLNFKDVKGGVNSHGLGEL